MSTILKALQKAEDEKAALGEGCVDLAHDILKRNYDEPKFPQWSVYLLGGTLGLFIISGVTLWVSKNHQAEPASDIQVVRPLHDNVADSKHA